MPLESKAQGRYLNWKFGHDWVKEHHFGGSQKGLPQRVRAMGGYGPNMPIVQGGPASRAMPRGMPLPFARPTAPTPVQPPPYGAPPGAPPIGGGVPYGGGPIAPPAPVLRPFLGGGGYQGTNPLRKLATGHRGAIAPRFGRGFNSYFMPRGFAGSAPRKMMARGGVAPASYHERVGGAVDPAVPTAPRPRRIQAKGGWGGYTRFWPSDTGKHEGGKRWGRQISMQPGSAIFGGKPWEYYDVNNPDAPWVGMEGPRGSLGKRIRLPDGRMGIVIDQKGPGGKGYGILTSGHYDSKGNLIQGTGRDWAHSAERKQSLAEQGITQHDLASDMFGRNAGKKGSGAPTRKLLAEVLTLPLLATPFAALRPVAKMAARGIIGGVQRAGERKYARQHGYLTPDQRGVPTGRQVRGQGRGEVRKARAAFGTRRRSDAGKMDRYDPSETFGGAEDISRQGAGFNQFDPREFSNTAGDYNPMPKEAPTDWSNIWQAPQETQGMSQGSNVPTQENPQPNTDYTYTDTSMANNVGGDSNFNAFADQPSSQPNIDTGSATGTRDDPYSFYSSSQPAGQLIQIGGGKFVMTTRTPPTTTAPMGSNVPTNDYGVMPDVVNTYRGSEEDDTSGGGTTTTTSGGKTVAKKTNPLAHAMGAYDPNYNYGTPKLKWKPGAVGSSNPEAEPGAFGDYTLNNASMFGPNTQPTIGGLGSYGSSGGGGFYRGSTNLGMALPGSFTNLGQGSGGNVMFGNYDYFGRESLRRLLHGGDPSLGWNAQGGGAIGDYGRFLQSHGHRNKRWAPMQNYRLDRAGRQRIRDFLASGGGGTPKGTGAVNPDFPTRQAGSRGRVVKPARRPLKTYGTDTVPIAAKPGEIILNEEQKAAVAPIRGLEHKLLPEQIRALARAKMHRRI